MKTKKTRKEKGITLIALVITIMVTIVRFLFNFKFLMVNLFKISIIIPPQNKYKFICFLQFCHLQF